MICGVGVDLVDVVRFARQLERTPALRDRLFTPAERGLSDRSLAARFAGKEALIKALGGSGELGWHDLEIVRGENRAPSFTRTAELARVLTAHGAGQPWLSIAHDGNHAIATVVLETAPASPGASTVEAANRGEQ
ncbi:MULTISPECIES: holo-ACP synthase [unclassified Leucobacter]|uniref:holo-ACP synthase n=1 Tax=unclassified Leucobacter TaxID=2621730 RepID=UPI00165E5142|nr:holo-ACP synthase [Leucobacter sp. CX169]MBC9927615.1 holo-ACP synthase [Leucobacter sp. cx-169]